MPWWRLRSRMAERAGEAAAPSPLAPSPLAPLPLGCLSATVELGGQADVDDETAARDAEGLIRFMRHRGALAGDAGEIPASVEAYPLEATEVPKAPVGGIVTYPVPLGARVARGDLVAEIVDVTATDQNQARHPVYAGIDGFILSQRLHRQVWPGVSLAKIVGREPIEGRSGAALLQP